MKNKLILFLILGIFLISFASATCTVTFTKTTHFEGELVTANLICSENGEKNIAYTLNWTNSSGYQLELDTGTTPSVRNTLFAQTYLIPSGYVTTYGNKLNATLQGTGLEGTDSMNISVPASGNLIIKNISITSEYFLGKYGAISFFVEDSSGNKISNARCIIDATDETGLPIFSSGTGLPTKGDGRFVQSELLSDYFFEKGKTYLMNIACACFNTTGYTSSGIGSCYEVGTGNQVTAFKSAQTIYPFTITDLADKMVVNKTVNTSLETGIWVENEGGFRANMTASLPTLYQENINWSAYNNSNGMAFLTAGEKFRICMYANNTFEEAKYIEMNHVHLIRNPGTEIFPYCMDGSMCEDKEIMHMEIQEGNYQKCGDWIKLPEYIKGQNNYKVIFHMGVEGYEQEVELSSDRFTVFGEKSNTDYIPLVDITNVTTNKYGANISSLSNIQVTFTYNYFGDDEDVFVAEYCFEQTDDDSIGGCFERYFNPDFGENKAIIDTFELPYFLNDGEAEVSITVFQNHDASRTAENIRGYGDTEPANTFTIKNFNVTNLTTSAFNSVVDACSDINVTLTYDFWGDENAIFSGEFCIENTEKDDLKKCEEVIINPDIGAGNTITLLLTLPYFDFGGEAEIELFLYKKYADGTKRFLKHGDTEPANTFNVTPVFTDSCKYSTSFDQELDLRSVEALEGINNKTGTFHLDVNCPSTGIIGSDMSCIITAYIEDSQTVQKEVDFTCYISDGLNQYSSVNFNQMITRNALSMSRNFAIPSSFNFGQQYVLQCTADYYNLGSRRDSFYDTFTASTTTGGSGSSGGSSIKNDTGRAPITGGVINEGDEKPKDDDKGILNEMNPLSPDRNWAFMFVELIILICLFLLILSCIEKKRKEKIHYYHEPSFGKIIKKVFAVIIILLIISLLGVGIWYSYSIVKGSFSGEKGVDQTTISEIRETSQILLQGNLIKSIFLIFIAILIISLIIILFTTILLLIVFKLLNVRGEIKFGHDHFTRTYYEDKKSAKLQQKLNHIILKNEIKRETTKEDYKVRKMSQQEFADFIKRKNQTS